MPSLGNPSSEGRAGLSGTRNVTCLVLPLCTFVTHDLVDVWESPDASPTPARSRRSPPASGLLRCPSPGSPVNSETLVTLRFKKFTTSSKRLTSPGPRRKVTEEEGGTSHRTVTVQRALGATFRFRNPLDFSGASQEPLILTSEEARPHPPGVSPFWASTSTFILILQKITWLVLPLRVEA